MNSGYMSRGCLFEKEVYFWSACLVFVLADEADAEILVSSVQVCLEIVK